MVDKILKKNFKYIYSRQYIDIHTLHLTFQMDSKSYNLQMNFDYQERWCDVLCFVSPRIFAVGRDNHWDSIQAVNYINWNVKSWGRYYIDAYGDLEYSLRLDYNVLESIPHECAKEIECDIEYYVGR